MRVVMVAEFDHAQGVQVNVALAGTPQPLPQRDHARLAPPDYVFDLIQISILAAAGDVQQLIGAVETARQREALKTAKFCALCFAATTHSVRRC
jgi:hypothetical protein